MDDTNLVSLCISIHAPTRGATAVGNESKRDHENFNPRSHEGSDTNPTEERADRNDFNPRSHEGSDLNACGVCGFRRISIHAPTRGATSLFVIRLSVGEISIHAPTRGATNINNCKSAVVNISIHAPTRGATVYTWIVGCCRRFQSTLPRGERLQH